MGILSWLRVRRSADQPERPKRGHSLVRYRYNDQKPDKVHRDAAADVAEVEKDEKYFRRDTTPWEG